MVELLRFSGLEPHNKVCIVFSILIVLVLNILQVVQQHLTLKNATFSENKSGSTHTGWLSECEMSGVLVVNDTLCLNEEDEQYIVYLPGYKVQ